MTSGKTICFAIILLAALVTTAHAEIVYNSVNVSIPVGGYYNIDLDGDGVTDFSLSSKLLQGYCQAGDEYVWNLTVTPSNGNAVVITGGHSGSDYASALLIGVLVNSSQSLYPSASVMAELYWGKCGTGTLGEWLNLPARYLGFQFQDAANNTHYGWAELSTVAYVDQQGHLQASTILSGFAYETISGQAITTGQATDAPDDPSTSLNLADPTDAGRTVVAGVALRPLRNPRIAEVAREQARLSFQRLP
jgi:hypothetical protein